MFLQIYKAAPEEMMNKGQDAIQLMEGVVRLSGTIVPRNVKDLQAFSDKIGNVQVGLQLLVDTDAIFTITNILKQKTKYFGMSEEEAKNWHRNWTHSDLG